MINPSGARGTARFARAVTAFTASLAVAGCSTSDTGEPGPRVTGAAIGVEGAHEHGVVRMGLAVDGTRLTLDMEAPGEAVFGFEHAPSSEEERSTVVQALERIRGEAGSLVTSK